MPARELSRRPSVPLSSSSSSAPPAPEHENSRNITPMPAA